MAILLILLETFKKLIHNDNNFHRFIKWNVKLNICYRTQFFYKLCFHELC